jgi:hypothetical protein
MNDIETARERAHESEIYAAFFMEGIRDAVDYNALLARWDKGCIELVSQVTRYTPHVAELVAAGVVATGNEFPGVYEYEVCSPFGMWWAKHIMDTGIEPNEELAKKWLTDATAEFFAQNGATRLGDHPEFTTSTKVNLG